MAVWMGCCDVVTCAVDAATGGTTGLEHDSTQHVQGVATPCGSVLPLTEIAANALKQFTENLANIMSPFKMWLL